MLETVRTVLNRVAGDCKLLNKKNLSTQPINSFDWHPDKRGLCCMGSFDQVRS